MRTSLFAVIAFFSSVLSAFAQQVVTTTGGEVLVLPFNPYSRSADPSLKELGEVKVSGDKEDGADFKKQLDKAAARAAAHGGNVLQVTDISDRKQSNHFKITGTACRASDYSSVKTKILEQKEKKHEGGLAAITIYRPVYAEGFNDEHLFSIVINDTLIIEMKAETRCVLKVAKEGDVRIAIKDESVVQHIAAHPGHDYYIRALVNYPGSHRTVRIGDAQAPLRGFAPYIEHVSDLQGELESSLVNKIILNKKI